jgi:hypothetical protein
MMDTVRISETSVYFLETTIRSIPEDRHLHQNLIITISECSESPVENLTLATSAVNFSKILRRKQPYCHQSTTFKKSHPNDQLVRNPQCGGYTPDVTIKQAAKSTELFLTAVNIQINKSKKTQITEVNTSKQHMLRNCVLHWSM